MQIFIFMKLLYLGISCKYKVTLSFAVSIPVNHLVRQYIKAFHEFHSIVNKITWDKESLHRKPFGFAQEWRYLREDRTVFVLFYCEFSFSHISYRIKFIVPKQVKEGTNGRNTLSQYCHKSLILQNYSLAGTHSYLLYSYLIYCVFWHNC